VTQEEFKALGEHLKTAFDKLRANGAGPAWGLAIFRRAAPRKIHPLGGQRSHTKWASVGAGI
jgi:hypothetical protein